MIHGVGESDTIYDYEGVETCKSAMQLSAGLKRCPYGCLGLGDCVKVCPVDAISINNEKGVAEIDLEKCLPAPDSIEKCPRDIIIPRDVKKKT